MWKWHLHRWAKTEALARISMAVKLQPLAVCLFLLWELSGVQTCSQSHNITSPYILTIAMENANINASLNLCRPKLLFKKLRSSINPIFFPISPLSCIKNEKARIKIWIFEYTLLKSKAKLLIFRRLSRQMLDTGESHTLWWDQTDYTYAMSCNTLWKCSSTDM